MPRQKDMMVVTAIALITASLFKSNFYHVPAKGSSSSLLVDGSGSSKMPRESAPEMATAESLVEELSEDEASGELESKKRSLISAMPMLH